MSDGFKHLPFFGFSLPLLFSSKVEPNKRRIVYMSRLVLLVNARPLYILELFIGVSKLLIRRGHEVSRRTCTTFY